MDSYQRPAGADNIWFTYAGMGDADVATVGAENSSGSVIVNDTEISADNAQERAIAATACN